MKRIISVSFSRKEGKYVVLSSKYENLFLFKKEDNRVARISVIATNAIEKSHKLRVFFDDSRKVKTMFFSSKE